MGVKVGGLNHPSIQADALGCGEGEELFLWQAERREFLYQLMIVLNGLKTATLIVVYAEDVWRVGVAPRIDEIGTVGREQGTIPPFLTTDSAHPAILTYSHYLPFGRRMACHLTIGNRLLLVKAANLCNFSRRKTHL